MTRESDPKEVKAYTVLTFDICSSTHILEDLLRTGSVRRWRNFHIKLKKFLQSEAKSFPFILYKFTGDGWILLFPNSLNGSDLMAFLKKLCNTFDGLYSDLIQPVLETAPQVIGITIGMDRGQLIKVKMNDQDEYIGRPINVACRLQGAIRDKDKKPKYKLLISKPFYEAIKGDLSHDNFKEVGRELRNIAGNVEIRCMKSVLME
jgi:class 3 adenylate cyclase